jgi:hypothetical protein
MLSSAEQAVEHIHTGGPEEWILWRRDFNKICTGMAMTVGSNRNRMVRQLPSDEPSSQFETRLATHATKKTPIAIWRWTQSQSKHSPTTLTQNRRSVHGRARGSGELSLSETSVLGCVSSTIN